MVTAGQTVSRLVLHMGVAFGVMYAMTGSVAFGGVAAVIEPICNVALLPLHDKLWQKIRGARDTRRASAQSARAFNPLTMAAPEQRAMRGA